VALSLQLHNINSRFNQYTFMLSLEVVGPGGSLSTVLIATPYWQDASGVLAGGKGDSGIQLRQDGGSAPSSAGERLVAATAERIDFDGDRFKICDIHSYNRISIRPFCLIS
jgi:hypothetical protein